MTQISILGCGWLGLPLAKDILNKGFSVKGSTTSVDKLSVLEKSGIQPFVITLSEDKTTGDFEVFLENSKILVVDIPPKLRGLEKENFVAKIKNCIPFIEDSSIEKVLFVGSTSVYGDTSTALHVTEETATNPQTESGKQLLETEQLLQNNSNFKTTILRFGGLIGEDRNPIKFLAGKTNLENPKAPVNLIHQEDCIGIMLKIIEQDFWNETLNAVTPFHPTRKEYYTQKAIDLNLELPQFNDENSFFGKTISSTKIETILDYTFVKPSL